MRSKILIGAVLALFLAGCGTGSQESSQSGRSPITKADAAPDRSVARNAEAICVDMVARSRRMGAEFRHSTNLPSDPLAMTTQNLIKPAIPIVEASSRELRALKGDAKSSRFDAYVNLFDPILALLRERVSAGERGDANRAHEIELQLIDLTALQRILAHRAGLGDCDVDFIDTFSSPGRTG